MADGFVAAFQTASGITVDYKEDLNDNEEWFAKVKEPLSRKQDIGADLAVPTSDMAARLHSLGWLNDISDAGVPNKKNLRSDVLPNVDPERKCECAVHVGPGRAGLQQGGHRPGDHQDRRPVGSRVQGQGQLVFRRPDRARHDHVVPGCFAGEPHAPRSVQKAVDLVREHKDQGQIRRFTGNDYSDDLAAGM